MSSIIEFFVFLLPLGYVPLFVLKFVHNAARKYPWSVTGTLGAALSAWLLLASITIDLFFILRATSATWAWPVLAVALCHGWLALAVSAPRWVAASLAGTHPRWTVFSARLGVLIMLVVASTLVLGAFVYVDARISELAVAGLMPTHEQMPALFPAILMKSWNGALLTIAKDPSQIVLDSCEQPGIPSAVILEIVAIALGLKLEAAHILHRKENFDER